MRPAAADSWGLIPQLRFRDPVGPAIRGRPVCGRPVFPRAAPGHHAWNPTEVGHPARPDRSPGRQPTAGIEKHRIPGVDSSQSSTRTPQRDPQAGNCAWSRQYLGLRPSEPRCKTRRPRIRLCRIGASTAGLCPVERRRRAVRVVVGQGRSRRGVARRSEPEPPPRNHQQAPFLTRTGPALKHELGGGWRRLYVQMT